MKKSVKILGYFGAGIFFFVFFLLWTFPTDVLKTRIINQIEDSMGGQYRIKVQSMSAGLIFGFTFKNVEVVKRDEGKDVLLLKSPKFRINPSFLALLRKTTKLSFSVDVGKGDLSGTYLDSASENEMALDFDDLNLVDLKFLSALYKINLKGMINGSYQVDTHKKDPSKNTGKIDLTLSNFSLDPIKFKMDPTSPESEMQIPEIKLSAAKNSKLIAEFHKSDIAIKELSFNGADVDLNLKGTINTAPRIDDYRMDISGTFKMKPELAQAIPIMALFEQQKQADGAYPLTLNGKLIKPSISVGAFKLPF